MTEEQRNDRNLWGKDIFQSDEQDEPSLGDPLFDEEINEEVEALNKLDRQIEAEKSQEHPEVKTLKSEVVKLQRAIEEGRDKLIRAQAEMENIRRRSKIDVEKAHKFSLEQFSKELLPVIDSLEKALDSATEADRIHLEGIELTLKLFQEVLKKFGIKAIFPLHEPFDPMLHEAVSAIPNPEVEPHTVLQVFQKGYDLNGRLIRPAKVVVSQGTH